MSLSITEAIDPICGMTVNTSTALFAERRGETFYFCSEHCRQKFLTALADSKPDAKLGSKSEGCCG